MNLAALPPDVRKGFAFPSAVSVQAMPRASGRGGASFEFKINFDGKAEPFRTSDGEAALAWSGCTFMAGSMDKPEFVAITPPSADVDDLTDLISESSLARGIA
jgi:hypothetical protein